MTPGILWVTFTFAGVLSLNRSFVQEKTNGCFEALMLCPVSRDVIYVGKMLSNLVFMLIVEIITLPVYSFLFNINVLSGELILITFLATIGFAAVGTLFSALAVNTKVRELVLPILFLPIVTPLLICAVNASSEALTGQSWADLSTWLLIILAYDVIFLVVSYLVFEHVIED
jgi:heme exporter protein B